MQGLDQHAGIHRHDDHGYQQCRPDHAVVLPVRVDRKHKHETGDRGDLADVHERAAGAETEAERREQVKPGNQRAVDTG